MKIEKKVDEAKRVAAT